MEVLVRDYALPLAIVALAAALFFHALAPARAEGVPANGVCDRMKVINWTPAQGAEEFLNTQLTAGKQHFMMGSSGEQLIVCAW